MFVWFLDIGLAYFQPFYNFPAVSFLGEGDWLRFQQLPTYGGLGARGSSPLQYVNTLPTVPLGGYRRGGTSMGWSGCFMSREMPFSSELIAAVRVSFYALKTIPIFSQIHKEVDDFQLHSIS